MSEKIRLNKFISDSGVCSRRQADKYIESGHVQVNGRRAEVGAMVSYRDKVLLNGQLIETKSEEEYILMAFNKPVGIVSTTEIGVRDSIIDYIGYHERIFPIGRLDKDSQGLIFLTNNGDLVNKILRADNKHEKEYVVTVDKPITDDFIRRLANGVPILGEITKKCKVARETPYIFRITLIQGLNRQVRRMCEYFGYEVQKLERVRIMNINLKNLPLGEWRLLNEQEMSQILKAIEKSSSEAKPSKPSKTTKPATSKPSASGRLGSNPRKPDTRMGAKKNTERKTNTGKPTHKPDSRKGKTQQAPARKRR